MDEPVRAAQVDERPVRRHAAHLAGDHVADLQLLEQLLALARAILILCGALRDDEPVALAVDLEDLHRDLRADQLHEVAAELTRDLAAGQEPAQTHDVDDQTALVLLANLGVEDLALGLLLRDGLPDAFRACLAEAEHDVAVLVLGLDDVDLDLVAGVEGDRLLATGGQLAVRDDPLALRTDVDEDLVGIDADDDSVNDVAVGQGPDRVLILPQEVFHGERFGLLRRRRGQCAPLLVLLTSDQSLSPVRVRAFAFK